MGEMKNAYIILVRRLKEGEITWKIQAEMRG
jgi:hypothetical protein